MCRHAAYMGPPCRLDAFLTAPAHSLVVQSHAAREFERTLVCADGYGFGWFNDDRSGAHYRSTLPIWQDPNLAPLANALTRRVWVANVRSATPPLPVSHENTHPFQADGLLFSHNGYIERFLGTVRPRVRQLLPSDLDATIAGSSDSELLFALVRRQWRISDSDLPGAVRQAFKVLSNLLPGDADALLNVIAATPDQIVATRYAIGSRPSPSLYTAADHGAFADGRMVASEPFDRDPSWEPVPAGRLIVLTKAGIEMQPL